MPACHRIGRDSAAPRVGAAGTCVFLHMYLKGVRAAVPIALFCQYKNHRSALSVQNAAALCQYKKKSCALSVQNQALCQYKNNKNRGTTRLKRTTTQMPRPVAAQFRVIHTRTAQARTALQRHHVGAC